MGSDNDIQYFTNLSTCVSYRIAGYFHEDLIFTQQGNHEN